MPSDHRSASTDSPDNTGGTLEGRRLVFVRHGVTDFTVSHRLDGRGGADPPLNAIGTAQAEATGTAVSDLVTRAAGNTTSAAVTLWCSSLHRVRLTATAVGAALGLTPQVDSDWDERCFGRWDGLTLAQIHDRFPDDLARMYQDPAYQPPGGESRADVAMRVLRGYRRLVEGEPGSTAVVVTSRVPLLVVLNEVLGIAPERFWALATEPASVTVVDLWADGHVSVPVLNRTDHLREIATD
ncbi:MAG: histidine phosphatase family protein [Actinomycetales bacterium]|nr:MAG: histidine phosphatase family protein [Actinomycetales bacterium]